MAKRNAEAVLDLVESYARAALRAVQAERPDEDESYDLGFRAGQIEALEAVLDHCAYVRGAIGRGEV